MVITGSNKSGKTTLLKRLIYHDLEQEKPPSLVIVDSHNDITPWLTKLDHFHPIDGNLKDKLVIFGRNPIPSINIFDQPHRGEEGVEDTLSILRYLFTGLGIDLTGHQNLFTPCPLPSLIPSDNGATGNARRLHRSARA